MAIIKPNANILDRNLVIKANVQKGSNDFPDKMPDVNNLKP